MTWKQFVDTVEKQMKQKGISENVGIWYIDVSGMTIDRHEEDLTVSLSKIDSGEMIIG